MFLNMFFVRQIIINFTQTFKTERRYIMKIIENWQIIATALLAVSEILGLSKKIKANSIFELIQNVLKRTLK